MHKGNSLIVSWRVEGLLKIVIVLVRLTGNFHQLLELIKHINLQKTGLTSV